MSDMEGAQAHPTGLKVGGIVERLELQKAWLVDPVSGREGPGEIVVIDGVLESVVWLEGEAAAGVTDAGVVVAPGFFDLHAHFREPGFEDAEPVATVSASSKPGSRKWACRSKKPGATTTPRSVTPAAS